MTWYAIYQTSDGRLRSEGSTASGKNPTALTAQGLAEKSFVGDRPTNLWNSSTLEYDIAPPAFYDPVSPVTFIQRFTTSEQNSLRNSNDLVVQTVVAWLQSRDAIDPGDEYVTEAMQYLVDESVITSARRDAILV